MCDVREGSGYRGIEISPCLGLSEYIVYISLMTKLITIELPEENEAAFWQFVKGLGGKEPQGNPESDTDISQWHKDGLDQIRAKTNPAAYIPLDAFLKEWESE